MLLNISGKIDPLLINVLSTISTIAKKLDIPFFLVGAMARDIIYEHCYEIKPPRATKDIDIGIRIPDLSKFDLLAGTLTSSCGFDKTNLIYRYKRNEIILDIIPFGPIANADMKIEYHPKDNIFLSVLGFEEAYRYSPAIRINDNPELDIKIPTIPGLFVMKLISWEEKYPDRKKDAQDMLFMLKNYEFTDTDRLYESEETLLKEEKFDVHKANIRLLGRDIVKMSNKKTITKVRQILTNETSENSYKLRSDMQEFLYKDNEEILVFLKKLKQGLDDSVI
ncbi:MAG: hypothetical protein A3J83_00720 [Elusimicrobia bacterium RIFOXYA2_FULL_40_6]|nr:MAG: hypothetical protein A3J83_00720 [Elusimicrobia bacterium RIFOXYA2_FULL_40_6]